jgi:hypothetical protein
MDPINDTVELRDYITDFIKRELIGPDPGSQDVQPNNGEEILRPQDPPRLRYSAGVLFPVQASVDLREDANEEEVEVALPVDQDEEETNGSDSIENYGQAGAGARRGEEALDADQEVNRANEFLPSAMGMSALVDVPEILRVEVSAAQYVKRELPGHEWINREGKIVPYEPHWRIPIQVEIDFESSELLEEGVCSVSKQVVVNDRDTGLEIHVLSRPRGPRHQRLITFTLVNRRTARSQRPHDDECFFQCKFAVCDPSGAACFVEYPERPGPPTDKEEASLRLLYRHRKVYAVGHGCAADWTELEEDRATQIWSESLPMYEVKPVLPRSIEGLELPMLTLSRESDGTVLELCSRLADEYQSWIEQQEQRIEVEAPDSLKDIAHEHIELCRECLKRMQGGIRLIREDATVRRAFALMNKAMLMQQIHYEISSSQIREWVNKDGGPPELEKSFEQPDYNDPKRRWRPFQLAFVLMTIRSIVEPECEEREIVDLIWFPTGGGKTEAYLGLSAFTILLRRLYDPDNAGTTVLMRYTLRLLTTQQFQRAASLICALEYLRRKHAPELGSEPVTIGLWVGGEVTPNKESVGRNNAVEALNKLQSGERRENPFIVLSCPWCGARMGPVKRRNHIICKGYHQLRNPSRVRFGCDDRACIFSGKDNLPLQVIDEAMYDEPPTLVIGTVDKFAMLPWRPEARRLFGLESNGRYAPPELVVQDELHLISGPLGSMVGHYETVIDLLCEKKHDGRNIPVKIVASTATISRASDQIHSLYSREKSFLFPPQGLSAGDSFFAEEREDMPGRLYTGIFASALPSHVTAQVNVLSALFQAIKSAPVDDPKIRDPYWTLMVYFNSLRELGHAATLIQADIRERMNAMWDRLGLTRNLGGEAAAAKRRFINHAIELTSRIQSSQIPEILQDLFTNYTGDGTRPVDVCLATNMIQVGLDVPRLSLMAVVGQPKTTSEYIQATSRVGRDQPGLVTTIYNPAKPRDRSHFEHFRAYHQAMYRHVEPTSVTPFAVPVRERALHALVVTLVRFWGNQAEREHPSGPPPRPELLQKVRDVILSRVEEVDYDELNRTREELDNFIEGWERSPHNKYGDFAPPTEEEVPLMYPAGSQPLLAWLDRAIPTPSSMRNVDATCDAQMIAVYPQTAE